MALCSLLHVLVLLFFLCAPAMSQNDSWIRALVVPKNSTVSNLAEKHIQSNVSTVLLPLLYLMAFLVGLPSNLLALGVLLFRTKRQPSTTLLINLTTCDLLLLVVLPFRIAYHFNGNNWTLGEPLCRLVMALFYGNMYGSVLYLALIAFDRYLALVHPIGGRMIRSYRNSVYMSVAAWAVVLIAMAPLLAKQHTYPINFKDGLNITTCHDTLPIDIQTSFFVPYFATLFATCFVIPLLVVLFCYGSILHALASSGRRYGHAVRVTVLVMTVFIVCLLPSNVLLFIHNSSMMLKDEENSLYIPYMLTLALSTFNNCLDPFIFYFVSEDFREKAQQVLFCRDYKQAKTSSQETRSSERSKVTLLSATGRVSATTEAASRQGGAV